MKFEIRDKIDYGFYKNIIIIGVDDKHYILKDRNGGTKKVYIELVDKHAVLIPKEKSGGSYPDLNKNKRNIIG